MSQDSITQLRGWIADQGLDAFLVAQLHNRSYLSGWFNEDPESSGMLLVGQHQQILLTNDLYKELAEREAVGWQIKIPEWSKYEVLIADSAKEHGWKKIGFEAKALNYWEYEKIRSAGDGIYTL